MGETTSGVLHPDLGSSAQGRHEDTKASPVEHHQESHGAGAWDVKGDAEETGVFSALRQDKGRSCCCL